MIGGFTNPILQGGATVSMSVDFSASTQSTEIGATISFTNLSDPTPDFNFWDFVDGDFSTASAPDKVYLSNGTYSITLNACDNISGGIETKTNYINISSPLRIIDILGSGSFFAYSLRKLSSTYTGSAIRVRRSNDNVEQDIGFDSNGDLDETALTSFVGANSGFIRTLYDQNGTNHAIQTNTSLQPRIVNSGTIEREPYSNKPAIRYGTVSSQYLTFTTTVSVANCRNSTLFFVTNGGRGGVSGSLISGINNSYGMRVQGGINNIIGINLVSANSRLLSNTNPPAITNNTKPAIVVYRTASQTSRSVFVNNDDRTETSTTSDNFSNTLRYIGRNLGTAKDQFNGYIMDLIMYPGDKTSSRTSVENDMFNYYW